MNKVTNYRRVLNEESEPLIWHIENGYDNMKWTVCTEPSVKATTWADSSYSNDRTTRDKYETNLIERQRQHLRDVRARMQADWQPCLHDQCPECMGTGVKKDGSTCIHMISCQCPKCTPR